jgi:protein-L-isoaspartate(D-aspartate) O-methyltransferase
LLHWAALASTTAKHSNTMDRLQHFRTLYANLTVARIGITDPDSRLRAAFASTPRERFIGPGPWRIFTPAGYVETVSDDPAMLYQDVVVALKHGSPINNGQPTLHAACLEALKIKEGETIIHVGAGTGYYTALLAQLTGVSGPVFAYEIEADLAGRASANLADLPNVTVYTRSGVDAPLPGCDIIYVSAGATEPMAVWLDALRPGGRLLFPLTPSKGHGGMLLVTRGVAEAETSDEIYSARFLTQAMFIPCVGARDEDTAQKLADAFQRGGIVEVRSLHRHSPPDETCWCAGSDWWLSKSPA